MKYFSAFSGIGGFELAMPKNFKCVGYAVCPPRLYERMQGLPDNWTDGVPNTARQGLIGNSITPDIPRMIIKKLIN